MESVNRKITYRLYPNATQEAALADCLALHCRASNTLMEEHRARYERGEETFNFTGMCRAITGWRVVSPALNALNAQSLQVTAKRVSLAFNAFFKRSKTGEVAGYPRFKSPGRFSGWGYKTYGDGWKLIQPEGANGKVRLSGIGEIQLRGKGRFTGTPKTSEILRKNGKWYLSVTYGVATASVARAAGVEAAAFDWGIATLLTIAKSDGTIETVDNPRWLKRKLEDIKILQRAISDAETEAKLSLGLDAATPIPKGAKLPVSKRLKRLYGQLAAVHGKIARQRHDFYHKLTGLLVSRFGFLGTEELAVKNMSKAPKAKPDPDQPGQFLPNGAATKAGLNRGILDAAPSMLLGMLKTKAEEAASIFAKANTLKVKPTQRCHRCGNLTRKTLAERTHRCACGCVCDRDENAARMLLRWLLEGNFWTGTVPGEPGCRIGSQETQPSAA